MRRFADAAGRFRADVPEAWSVDASPGFVVLREPRWSESIAVSVVTFAAAHAELPSLRRWLPLSALQSTSHDLSGGVRSTVWSGLAGGHLVTVTHLFPADVLPFAREQAALVLRSLEFSLDRRPLA